MNIMTITGLCIISTIICKIFDRNNKEYSFMIALITASFVLFMIISYISPVIKAVENIFTLTGISKKYLEIIFKAI